MRISALYHLIGASEWNREPTRDSAAPDLEDTSLQDDIETIRDHFDADFYREQNGDVRQLGVDPLKHFCEFGWREMRDPSPSFSTLYYLSANPHVRDADINPLVHFVTVGQMEGRQGKVPNRKDLFEQQRQELLKEQMLAVKPYFDATFYLGTYGDVAETDDDPLEHYMRHGWREGRDPSAYFSTSFYLSENPDVVRAGVNPFWHYAVAGRQEGRPALPAESYRKSDALEGKGARQAGEPNEPPEITTIRPHFDTEFYLEQCPDLRDRGTDPIEHYLREGWLQNLDPARDFSTAGYIGLNPDVAQAKVNPFWHYIAAGREEGRQCHPPQIETDEEDNSDTLSDIETIRPHFDAAFYLSRNPDIQAVGVDPLEHYLLKGWKEGRDPCATFSTKFYLDSNLDVATLGINPFWHYIVAGRHEGRTAMHPGGYKAERLRKTVPLEEEVRRWRSSHLPDSLLNAKELTKLLSGARHADRTTLLLSVGHDNYRKVSGGIQLCEHREEALSLAMGRRYLNLHPWQPLPRLAKENEDSDPIMSLLLEGREVGQCRISDIIRVVGQIKAEYEDVQVVVHQLLGHLPERIADLICATGRNECWLWLHDFFTICPSFNLQRNGVTYCGAPEVTSNSCRLCRFGIERLEHRDRIKAFFDRIDVKVLAPSKVTAETWQERADLASMSLEILPHMALEWRKRTVPLTRQAETVTIGFLGTPAPHKGWQVFESLYRKLRDDGRYLFVFLGSARLPLAGIEHQFVHVTAEDSDAMINAVSGMHVDIALHWASWPETFSLSAYEAYAGGAYVITNSISGNVAATVETLGRGAVLRDEPDLMAFFDDGRVDKMIAALRSERRRYEVHHHLSRMVHDAIDAEQARGDAE